MDAGLELEVLASCPRVPQLDVAPPVVVPSLLSAQGRVPAQGGDVLAQDRDVSAHCRDVPAQCRDVPAQPMADLSDIDDSVNTLTRSTNDSNKNPDDLTEKPCSSNSNEKSDIDNRIEEN